MDEAHMVEIIMGIIAFLAAAGWAQTNYRINNKVNCELCEEKEKRSVSRFKAVDAQLVQFAKQIDLNNIDNKEDHSELKLGVKEISTSSVDTKIELVKISSCLDKLYKELKELKEK